MAREIVEIARHFGTLLRRMCEQIVHLLLFCKRAVFVWTQIGGRLSLFTADQRFRYTQEACRDVPVSHKDARVLSWLDHGLYGLRVRVGVDRKVL